MMRGGGKKNKILEKKGKGRDQVLPKVRPLQKSGEKKEKENEKRNVETLFELSDFGVLPSI